MKKIEAIWNHPKFRHYLALNEEWEKDRIFCLHDKNHMLDVARIGYILNLEQNLGFEKELIYAAALLHDIGKWMQYQDGTPHHKASAFLCMEILQDAGFSAIECHIIQSAIATHKEYLLEDASLNRLLYVADKKSRLCFACAQKEHCNWKDSQKNHTLTL